MRKPTDASVTELPCQCGYLEQNARDPRFPVRFDEEYNEYYFDLTLSKGTPLCLLIYHCPMCGGVASESKREDVFAIVTEEERFRVNALIRGFKTVEDIVSTFGPPDRDSTFQLPEDLPAAMLTIPGTDLQQAGPLRQLTYEQLSGTADVQFTIYSNGKVEGLIFPKYLGASAEVGKSTFHPTT